MTHLMKESPTLKSQRYDLSGAIVRVDDLSSGEKDAMFALMLCYYETSRRVFNDDLAEKEHVILLRDATSNAIKGFSTMKRLDLENVTALFSGDTIIHEDYRHTTVLPQYWAKLAFGTHDQIKVMEPERSVYWFLITSGYKTYRYLPVFFREFYPHYDCPTPSNIQAIMYHLAKTRYGKQYDKQTGIIRLENATPLREGVAEIQPHRLKNAHIAFFDRINPGHAQGDELVCLTEIDPDNLTRAGRRMVDAEL